MSHREATLQQRDPMAALVGRTISYLPTIGVSLYAGSSLWANRFEVDHEWLALTSVFLIVATALYVGAATSPMRAPFSAASLVAVTVASLGAIVLGALSMWESNALLRDDWAVPSLGFLFLGLAAFRPAHELTIAGLLSSLFVGALALAQVGSLDPIGPNGVVVLTAMAPVLVLSLAAASFSRSVVDELDRWEQESFRALRDLAHEGADWVARSVQQDRVTILNRDVIPFFTAVLDAYEITEADRRTAHALSQRIRAIMVADVERSWIDGVIETARLQAGVPASDVMIVHDDRRLAAHMSIHQRTAVRAMIVALHSAPGFSPDTLRMDITSSGRVCTVRLSVEFGLTSLTPRAVVEPFLAVMQVLFTAVHAEASSRSLTVQFSYDQR